MLKKAAALIVFPLFALGCAYEVGEEDQLGEEDVVEVQSAVELENALLENAISTNAISTNAISTNALSPSAIPSTSMDALQNNGGTGMLARMLVKYLVSCALSPAQSFSFSWTDTDSVVRNETFWGALSIAPTWTTRGLTTDEQKWVSACITARVNFYGIPVLLSLRGSHSSMVVDSNERTTWSQQEGAFWGNIFSATPMMRSCYKQGSESHSRSKMRDCAAGHWDGTSAINCGNVLRQGTCESACVAAADPTDGYVSCGGESAVITTYLPD